MFDCVLPINVILAGLSAWRVPLRLAVMVLIAGITSWPCRAELPRSVLIIDESDPSSGTPTTFSTTLRSTLNNFTPRVVVFGETLDLSRFSGPKQEATLRTYVQQKYSDVRFGVIVAVGAGALGLVTRWRSELWPDAAVVFAAIDELTASKLKFDANTTGLIMRRTIDSMMKTARILVPDLQGVALVGGRLEKDAYRLQYLQEIPVLAAKTNLIDLTGLPLPAQLDRAAGLPDKTAILYTSLFIDDEGTRYSAADALTAIARVANRPIAVDVESLIGFGATGGFVLENVAYGKEVAALAVRILDGAGVTANPIAVSESTQPIFDWRQLDRWGISESRLPPGSQIRYRPFSAWEQYRAEILAVCVVLLMQTALIGWLFYERRHRRQSEAAAYELSGRLINAQEDERSRLARELHDDVTQRLALLAIEAERGERGLPAVAGGSANRAVRDGLASLSEDVHALSYRLHSSILEDLGLIEALKAECETFSRRESVQVAVRTPGTLGNLPRDVSLNLFRVAQEALRNVGRHAHAKAVEVSLRRLDDGVELAVHDDGRGFDSADRRGRPSLGHESMRQRVRLVGGELHIDSAPGRGTMVVAWVPLKESQAEARQRSAG